MNYLLLKNLKIFNKMINLIILETIPESNTLIFNYVQFISGVLTSLIATLIYLLIKNYLNLIFYYPNIQDNWRGTYKNQKGIVVEENIIIKQQFFCFFRGIATSSLGNGKNEEGFIYKFNGRFKTKDIISVEFKPNNRFFMDYGSAIYKLDNSHLTFKGYSVSCSRETNNIFSTVYNGQRVSK